MKKIRKSIDIPEVEFKKLQLQALINGTSVKCFIETLIISEVAERKTLEQTVWPDESIKNKR